MWAALVAALGIASFLIQYFFNGKAAAKKEAEHQAELEKVRRSVQDGKVADVPQQAPGVTAGQSAGWDAADGAVGTK